MSVQENDNQVDFIPDAEVEPTEKEPEVSCTNCIHKDVCYFLTTLDQAKCSFEASGVCKLPYKPTILAATCSKFDNGKSVADKLTRDDTEIHPDDLKDDVPKEE